MTILLYDPFVDAEEAAGLGVIKLELNELLTRADVVSLHAPANKHTYKMLNAKGLALMKDDALLINTGRGSLIEEPALIEELSKGRFFAFLDFTDTEPPAADSPLRSLPNVIVTPHIAGVSRTATIWWSWRSKKFDASLPGNPRFTKLNLDLSKGLHK